MGRATRLLLFSGLLAILCSCVSMGKEFNYQNKAELNLGATSEQEALALFGDPERRDTITHQNETHEVLRFLYAYGNLGGTAVRVLLLDFKDGVLTAYVYSSGFEEDATDFDTTAFGGIQVGTDTQGSVNRLLGEPTGKCRGLSALDDYKGRCSEGMEVWSWTYVSRSEGLDTSSMTTKTAYVCFDEAGVVSQVLD